MYENGQQRAGIVSKRRAMLLALVMAMSAGMCLDVPTARGDGQTADFPELNSLRQAVMQRDVKTATQIADEIVTKNPNNPNAYVLRAELYSQINALDKTRADLEKALSIEPMHPRATILFATLLARAGDTAGAMKRVDDALIKHKDSPELLGFRADLLTLTGKTKEAAEVLEATVKTTDNPQTKAEIYGKLAQLYGREKSFKKAAEAATRAIEIKPEPSVVLFRAQVYEADGQLQPALRDYESVQASLGATGGTPDIRKNLATRIRVVKGKLNQQAEQEAKAKAAWEVEQLAPKRKEMIELATAYQNNPADPKALDALVAKACLVADTITLEAEESLIPMHPLEYRSEDSAANAEPVNTALPEVITAQTKARELYRKVKVHPNDDLKKPAEARQQLDEVIAVYPYPDALLRRGQLNFIEGDEAGAVRDAALSASIAALEAYQTKTMPQGFFTAYTPVFASRRLLTQLRSRARDEQTEKDKQIALFLGAVEGRDWLAADRAYRRNEAKWRDAASPVGNLYAKKYYVSLVQPEADKVIVAQINRAVDSGNAQAVGELMTEIKAREFYNADGFLALYRAHKLLKNQEQARLMRDKAIDYASFSPEVWLVLGSEAEKEGDIVEAMVLYNVGVAGKKAEVLAKPTAQKLIAARDRLEKQLGAKESLDAYAKYINEKNNAPVPPTREQNLVLDQALTRMIERRSGTDADLSNLYFVRGRTRYHLDRFDSALKDFAAVKSTNKNLLVNTYQMMGATYSSMAERTPKEKAVERKVLLENAIAAYTKGIEAIDTPMLRFGRGIGYMQLEQADLAEKDYQSAAERLPDTKGEKAVCYFQLSKIKHARGDIQAALKDSEMTMVIARKVYDQVPMEMTLWSLQLSKNNLDKTQNKKD